MFETLVNTIINYVEVDPESITRDSRLVEDLGLTSFDIMSMLGELEDTLEVEIEQADAAQIVTVGDAVDYLEKLVQEQG
ncbi:MAG: acyl carrier protein [Clostridiales bacterium]|nr:acyl carrier protein [Clostridiales bacterium]